MFDIDLPGDGVPSSERIVQDCERAVNAMRIVCENKGRVVPGLADRNGHRYTREGTNGPGGDRKKNYVLQEGRWVHPLVRDIRDDTRRNILAKFNEMQGSDVEEVMLSDENSTGTDILDDLSLQTEGSDVDWAVDTC